MLYLAIGALALTFVVWMGGTKLFKARNWRFLSSAGAVVAFAGAAFAGMREAWVPAAVLVVFGMWLAVTTRSNGPRAAAEPAREMSLHEARSLLGVSQDATPAQIKAAYARLMRVAHPDKGGTAGLAAQLNAARDRLLRS